MTSSSITQWLQQPATDKDMDKAAVEALVEKYPYFLPARYMAAATLHTAAGYAPDQLAYMRLYSGNWLLLHELLAKAATPAPEPVTVPDAGPSKVQPPVTTGKNAVNKANAAKKNADTLTEPAFATDYFRHEGIIITDELPEEPVAPKADIPDKKDPRSLMVVMSFSDWLMHFRTKSQKEKEEEEDRKAMKSMWQKEKLAAALEEENDEIPENVFEMAVHSLDKDEGLVSESLAEILTKQGKTEKAIEMYKKLSLRNPQKRTYFAQQISILQKNTEI